MTGSLDILRAYPFVSWGGTSHCQRRPHTPEGHIGECCGRWSCLGRILLQWTSSHANGTAGRRHRLANRFSCMVLVPVRWFLKMKTVDSCVLLFLKIIDHYTDRGSHVKICKIPKSPLEPQSLRNTTYCLRAARYRGQRPMEHHFIGWYCQQRTVDSTYEPMYVILRRQSPNTRCRLWSVLYNSVSVEP